MSYMHPDESSSNWNTFVNDMSETKNKLLCLALKKFITILNFININLENTPNPSNATTSTFNNTNLSNVTEIPFNVTNSIDTVPKVYNGENENSNYIMEPTIAKFLIVTYVLLFLWACYITYEKINKYNIKYSSLKNNNYDREDNFEKKYTSVRMPE